MLFRLAIICSLCCLLPPNVGALGYTPEAVVITSETTEMPLVPSAKIIKDPQGKMSADDFMNPPAGDVAPRNAEFTSFGFSRAAYWLYIPLNNKESAPLQRLLVLEPTWLENVQLTLIQNHVRILEAKGGTSLPFSQREVLHPNINFNLTLPPGKSQLLIRIQSRDPVDIAMTLWDRSAFFESQMNASKFWGLTYGILGAMLLYNLFLFFSVRETTYVAYATYLFSFLIMHATLNGLSYQIFWPDSPSLNKWALTIFVYLFMLSGLVFAIRFLELRTRLFPAYRLAKSFILLLLASFVVTTLLGGYRWNIFSATLWAIIYGPFVALLGIWSLKAGNRAARFFFIGTASGFIGSCITALTTPGFIPFTFLTYRAVDFGMTIDALLLSFALADRIAIMRQEKEMAQAKLKSNDERWRLALESAGEGAWDWNVQTNNVVLSRRWKEMLGYTEHEVENNFNTWEKLIYPPDRPHALSNVQDYLSGKIKAYRNEFRMLCKDGSWKWILAQGAVVERDGNGQPLRIIGTHIDISETKSLEEDLKNLNEHLEERVDQRTRELEMARIESDAIIASLPGIFYVLSPQGQFMRVNHLFLKVSGYSDEELGHLTAFDFFDGEDKKLIALRMTEVFESGNAFAEADFVTKSGIKIPYYFTGHRASIDNQHFIVGIGIDMSERKKIERSLTESMHKLEEKELAKTRFLAAAGHDLRQPLAAANLFIDALQFTEPNADQNEIIRRLEQSMAMFNGLLDALLNISKLDAGVIRPEYTSVNVAELFTWLEQSFAALAGEKHLGFKLYFPMRKTLVIHCDIGLLRSVLINLVSNAIKYTAKGAILVSARQRGDKVLFQVWDTGIGIEAEYLTHIFDEFYQINNPQRDRAGGLGLGLAIAKRAVALLDGEITCRSQIGRGSVFGFSVPLGSLSGETLRQVVTEAPQDTNSALFAQNKHFVVVEDDQMLAQALVNLLERIGGNVTRFSNADDALLDASINDADYYIADYMLGGTLNGIQFLTQLRQKLGKPIHAVLITGDTSPTLVHAAENCEWPVLHKPVNISRLFSSLRTQEEPLA